MYSSKLKNKNQFMFTPMSSTLLNDPYDKRDLVGEATRRRA